MHPTRTQNGRIIGQVQRGGIEGSTPCSNCSPTRHLPALLRFDKAIEMKDCIKYRCARVRVLSLLGYLSDAVQDIQSVLSAEPHVRGGVG